MQLFILIMSLNLLNNSVSRCHHPHFSDKETDTQRGKLVCDSGGRPQTPAFLLENGRFSYDTTAVTGMLSPGMRKTGWREAEWKQLLSEDPFGVE